MSKITAAGRAAVIACVLAALLIPAAALAGPGQGGEHGKAATRPAPAATAPAASRPVAPGASGTAASRPAPKASAKGQPANNLSKRVTNVLAARKRRFDAATAAIAAHIARVSALTEKVKAAGGDVSKVESALAEANAALDSAKSLEAELADELQAVPGSANPKAGLAAARTTGRKAVAELKTARSKVIEAVHALRSVVQGMEDSGETSDSP